MSRAAAALRALAVVLAGAALLGVVEGVLAESLPGESAWARILGLVVLDSVVLGLPLGVVAGVVAALRGRSGRRPRRTVAAAAFVALLLGGGAWRLVEVLEDFDLDRLQTWHLERPIPLLRSEGGGAPIVLISLDTLRFDHLEHMPRLRAWMARGRSFTQARTPSPWTLPAMASVHTGLVGAPHGAGRRVDGRPLHHRTPMGEVTTLAERLRSRGYVSGAVVTNPFLGARYGFAAGFDRFQDLSHRTLRNRALRRGRVLRGLVGPAGDTAERVTERGLEMLGRVAEGRFFVWVHYLDAHAPFASEPEGFDPYGPCDLPACFDDWRAWRAGFFAPGPPEQEVVRELYRADVAWLDHHLGELLDGLGSLGLMDEALVVLLADHGEEFWDHGGGEHGHSFHEELVRVPLVVWGPGVEPGEDDRSVGLAAVHSAALSFASGAGLGPLAPDAPPQQVGLVSRLFGPEAVGCTDGRFKLVTVEGSVLYDLVVDPGETRDVIASHPVEAARLRACSPVALAAVEDDGSVDDEVLLRGLGYVE